MNIQRVQAAMVKRAGVLADMGNAGLTAANWLANGIASMFKSPPRTATPDQINDVVMNYVRNNTSPETLADFRRNFKIAPEIDDAIVMNYWADRYKNRMQREYDNYFRHTSPEWDKRFESKITDWVKQHPMRPYRYNHEPADLIKPEHRVPYKDPAGRGGASGSW